MAHFLVHSAAVAFRSWGVVVRISAVCLLLLVAAPFTHPCATLDLFDVPAGHDDSGGAVIKHKDAADGTFIVPAVVELAMFVVATDEPQPLPDRVIVWPVTTAVLRI